MMMGPAFLWAVSILCVVPRAGEKPMQQAEIANRVGVSSRYLEPMLQHLSGEGLLIGKRGPRGGCTLADAGESISLAAVAQAVDRFRSHRNTRTKAIDVPAVLSAVFAGWREDLSALSVAQLRGDA